MLATIVTKEKGKVAVVHVPEAYLQTDLKDEKVFVKLDGKLAELPENIEPKCYSKLLIFENSKKTLYAELAKILYGIFREAILL